MAVVRIGRAWQRFMPTAYRRPQLGQVTALRIVASRLQAPADSRQSGVMRHKGGPVTHDWPCAESARLGNPTAPEQSDFAAKAKHAD